MKKFELVHSGHVGAPSNSQTRTKNDFSIPLLATGKMLHFAKFSVQK